MFKALFQFFFGKCQSCQTLRTQNEYLQKLTDRLLEARGTRPVNPEPPEKEEIDEELAALQKKGALFFGESGA